MKIIKSFFFAVLLLGAIFVYGQMTMNWSRGVIVNTNELYSSKIDSINNWLIEMFGIKGAGAAFWEYRDDIEATLKGAYFDDFIWTNHKGNQVKMSDFNTPVLVELTSSSCRPCITAQPALNQLAKEYEGKLKIIVIMALQNEERDRAFIDKYDERITVVPSDVKTDLIYDLVKVKAGDFKHIFTFPFTFFIDARNRVVDTKYGGSSSGTVEVDGKEVTIPFEKGVEYSVEELRVGVELALKSVKP